MSASTKGKQATKGQKQIFEENGETIRFYLAMTAIPVILHLVIRTFLLPVDFTLRCWSPFVWTVVCQTGALLCMQWMAKPLKNSKGQILDAGLDLNMEGGFGEYCKDIVILSAAVQVLALVSNYFYLFCLAVPVFAFYKLWVGILGPWFFAPASEESDSDEKKKRKKDRKQKRI